MRSHVFGRARATAAAVAAAATVAALALSGCASGQSADDGGDGARGSRTVKVALVGISSDAALKLGQDRGIFKKHGITVETKVVPNPAAGIGAAQSGQFDFAYAPSVPMLTAMSQGVDLKIAAPADGYPDDALEQDPRKMDDTALMLAKGSKIARPKQLEGKKVAVPARKAQLEVTVSELIRKDGGDPSRVRWQVLDFPSAVQSLEQKHVDAAALVAPFQQRAERLGATWFAAPGVKFFERGAIGLYVAGPRTVKEKPRVVAAFRAAVIEANAYASEHRDEAIAAAAKITGQRKAVIAASAETFWPQEVRLADIQRTNRKLVSLGFLEKKVPLNAHTIVGAEKSAS